MTQQQAATMNAMEAQRPFSWLKGRTVQAGVYLNYSQQFWWQYKMA